MDNTISQRERDAQWLRDNITLPSADELERFTAHMPQLLADTHHTEASARQYLLELINFERDLPF